VTKPTTKPATTPEPKTRVDHALDLARRGFRVFRVKRNGKSPMHEGWQGAATRDESIIREWFDVPHPPNIGIFTDNLLVVDVDKKKGGLESFKALSEQQAMLSEPFPKTLHTMTWSGGAHIFYRLPEGMTVANGVDVLAPGIDIRGRGGLVVAAGSDIDGNYYHLMNDRPMAEAPAWLIAMCDKPREKAENAGKRLVEETPELVAKARAYVQEWAPEAHTGNLDHTAYEVAARLFDFGVETSTAFEIMCEWNETKAGGAIPGDDLLEKIENAAKHRQNPIGIRTTASGFEAVEVDERKRPSREALATALVWKDNVIPFPGLDEVKVEGGAYKFTWARAITFEHKEYLIDGFVCAAEFSAWYGDPDSGKSTGILHGGASVASGRPFQGRSILNPGPVLYVAAERGGVTKRRIMAWQKHFQVTDLPLAVIDDAVNLRTNMVDAQRIVAACEAMAKECGRLPVWIILDTLNRVLAGGDENSSMDMGSLIKAVDYIMRATRAHTSLVHHTPLNKDRMRGHGSVLGAVDMTAQVKKDGAIVQIAADKGNDLPDKPEFEFQFQSVDLGVNPRTGFMTTAPVLVEVAPWEIDLTPEQQAVIDRLEKLAADKPGRYFSVVEAYQNPTEWGALGDPEKADFRRVLDALNETQRILKVSAKGKKTLYKLKNPTNPTKPNK
jgi:hypothetical protein